MFQRHHARNLIKTFREESELISLLNIGIISLNVAWTTCQTLSVYDNICKFISQ